jgi:hypothetical protein
MSGFAVVTGTDNPRAMNRCFENLPAELVTVLFDDWIAKHPESAGWPARIALYRAIGESCK